MHPYIKSYPSNKVVDKKPIGLFHLLTYFDINKKNKNIKKLFHISMVIFSYSRWK